MGGSAATEPERKGVRVPLLPRRLGAIATARSLRLADGRRLGWIEVGDPDGEPVLHLHGTPGAAAEATPLTALAVEAEVRLIAVDRPGLGASDPHPDRSVPGFVDDVVELADRLELHRPPVIGFSGGGPYALAFGARAPERFGTIGVLSGAGPIDSDEARKAQDLTDRLLTWLSYRAPAVGGQVVWLTGQFTRLFPAIAMKLWEADLSEADRRQLREGGQRARVVMQYLAQATIEGARGVVDDERLLAEPWGFDPADVRSPVIWWHGEEDHSVPLPEARRVADALPDVDFRPQPDAGHLLWPRVGVDALRTLTGQA